MRSATLALLCLPVTAAAQAADPLQCVRGGDVPLGHAPVDLGDGLVAQEHFAGSVDEVPDGVVDFAHCESGGRLLVALPPGEDGTRPQADDVIAVMQGAMAEDEEIPVERLATYFTSVGAPAQVRVSDAETCGCAVFYPDAVGDKTPWSAPE
ncbi:NADH dehydrogenase subunit J [Oceanicola granulosus HTCC2516]|uniref:NADH dehydrogenase subunit J n=1 Tax=Oceanicola granulosus (strain ATCC BAA-861 / DSM 15982 / KCTC 12143 / HTCC2516) TaxID=314256 RepID=Q2CCJ0_OCEGH|nr:hypothetical protein [Oceanicola granulosus]EAR50423.1 NADH dehydrogenase subunit J [Oceanicola granulosus HTCC2516]